MRQRILLLLGIFIGFVLCLPNIALALSFELAGLNYNYNTAQVNFNYDYKENSGYGKIDVDIRNTGQYDPVITGFTFNTPDNIDALTGFCGPCGWNGVYDSDSISTPEPFGLFDVAAITGNNVEGGNPQKGIPQGELYSFDFIFSGSNLSSLNTSSFLNEFSYVPDQGRGSNGTPVYFLARVQQVGANGELSDVMIPDNQPKPIPEPTTILLLGTGLLGVAILSRKTKNKK